MLQIFERFDPVRIARALILAVILGATVSCSTFHSAGVAIPSLERQWQNATKINRSAWLNDFEVFKKALEAGYPNLVWFASKQSGIDLPVPSRQKTRC